jgi:hypothetical protein
VKVTQKIIQETDRRKVYLQLCREERTPEYKEIEAKWLPSGLQPHAYPGEHTCTLTLKNVKSRFTPQKIQFKELISLFKMPRLKGVIFKERAFDPFNF